MTSRFWRLIRSDLTRTHAGRLWRPWPLLPVLLVVACVKSPAPVSGLTHPSAEVGGKAPESRAPTEKAVGKEGVAPEPGTGWTAQSLVTGSRSMVAAANPHASRAGMDMLKQGGNAVDAAIAMSMTLGLVEPQSSGLGGGGFLLSFNAGSGKLTSWDGREAAPKSATPTLFMGNNGKPRDLIDAIIGGQSVGVPGLLRMLEQAHQREGKLPWSRLFQPAIRLAEEGFEVSPRLHSLIKADPLLPKMSLAKAYFYTSDGQPLPIGYRLKNPAYAQVLRAIARDGAKAFYEGAIAQDIVTALAQAERNPARMTLEELAAYRAKERTPVCLRYQPGNPWHPVKPTTSTPEVWQVCGMGPPSSGSIAVGQILGMLSPLEPSRVAPDSVDAAHLLAEAGRLAFADRGKYIADPDFVDIPTEKLLTPAYLRARSLLIHRDRSMGVASAGELNLGRRWGTDRALELPSTSHMVVIDRDGNAVSMTATIESAFGSRLMVRGFLLNNELTDFSFIPEENGLKVANCVEAGKRPRSAMAPTVVMDEAGKKVVLLVGSPGGSQIISYVAQTLMGVGEWGLDLQQAISAPHIVNRNGRTELERVPGDNGWLERTTMGLKSLGHEVAERELNSGIQGIFQQTLDGKRILAGAADPRREGLVLTE